MDKPDIKKLVDLANEGAEKPLQPKEQPAETEPLIPPEREE